MKNPWNDAHITNNTWKTVLTISLLSIVTVNAANNHVKPKSIMTPTRLVITRKTVLAFSFSFVRSNLDLVLRNTITMVQTNITTLARRMRKIGPKKAPKKTAVCFKKQL